MALPLAVVAVAWILLLSVIVALCHVARLGDLQRHRDELPRPAAPPPRVSADTAASGHSRDAGYPARAFAQAGGAQG